MEHKVKTLQETKIIFDELKIDRKSVLFSIDKLDTKELKNLKNDHTPRTSSCWNK